MNPRREFALAVVACAGGAGLALFAAGRGWWDGEPAVSGSAALPWVTGLAFVALAGAGALVATRRTARTVVAGLVAVVGLGLVAGAGIALFGPPPEAAGSPRVVWPVTCAIGGLVVTLMGGYAAKRARLWPEMGVKYERATKSDKSKSDPEGALWEAIDRGEDPTARE